MKSHRYTVFLLLCVTSGVLAQESGSEEEQGLLRPGVLRAEENNLYLKDHAPKGLFEHLKYIPLGNQSFLSFGGHLRQQYEYFRNFEFGEVSDDPNGWLIQRLMLHSDLRVGNFRLFAQLQSSHHWFETVESLTIDRDDLALHQGFLEYKFKWRSEASVTTRFGRQELSYGDQRLFTLRNGPNVRQTFDVAKICYEDAQWRMDVFYARPIENRLEVFDNPRITNEEVWAAYSVFNTVPWVPGSMDVYYVGFRSRRRVYEEGIAQESRHSVGTRHWGKIGRFRFDHEFTYQFGRFGDGNLSAFAVSFDLGYQLSEHGWQPEIGLKTEVISGDRVKRDGDLNTFSGLYPNGAYYGLIALFGPANLIDFHPSVTMRPFRNYLLILDWDFFWRYDRQDGIYAPNGSLLRAGDASDERYYGHQPGFEMLHEVGRYWEFAFEGSWFVAGDFFADTGEERNVLHFAITSKFKF